MYRPSRIDAKESTGESDRPDSEARESWSDEVSSRWTCLSAPAEAIKGRDAAVEPVSSLEYCHASTDAVRIFDDVGVLI